MPPIDARHVPVGTDTAPPLHEIPRIYTIAAPENLCRKYRRRSPHSGQVWIIQVSGIVSTGAAICSHQPLQAMTKS